MADCIFRAHSRTIHNRTAFPAVERFIAQQNILSYQKQLLHEADDAKKRVIAGLLVKEERALALARSDAEGASANADLPAPASEEVGRYLKHFHADLVHPNRLLLLLDPRSGLPVLAASVRYAAATNTHRENLCGRHLFEVFPDNPDDSSADGVANLFASLRIAAQTLQLHIMEVQRYDVRDANGIFVERHWLPTNSPILASADKTVLALLHEVEDVTEKQRA